MTAQHYIDHLKLLPHPEGGYYKETYRAEEIIGGQCLPVAFGGSRNISTAIYYLLEEGHFSAFHKIKSDECWHFYTGGTLLVHMIDHSGSYKVIKLGGDITDGEVFQFVVPANTWFASEPALNVAFSLVGCTVAPGFDFNDFEMAAREQLLLQYPHHADIINRLV
jgi:hypothetical protein